MKNANLIKAIKHIIYMNLAKTDKEIAKIIGQNNGNLSNFKNGHKPIPENVAESFQEKFGIYKEFILGNSDIMLYEDVSDNDSSKTYQQKRLENKNTDNEDVIPLFDSVIAQQSPVSNSLIPTTETDKKGFIKSSIFKNAQYVIYASGNSMLPSYPPDAAIGIRKIDPKHISPGSVYAIDIGSDLLLKRLFYKDDDQYSGVLLCESDNKMIEDAGFRKGKLKYPPQFVDIVEVLGVYKVTDVYKRNEITVIQ